MLQKVKLMPVNNMDNINLEAIFNGTRQLTEYTPSYSYVVDYKQPVWGCLFFIPSTHLLDHTISLITSQIRQYDSIGGYDKLHVAELEAAIPLMEGLIAALYTISHFNPLLSSEDVPALCDKLLDINMDRKCLAPDGYFEYEYNCYYKAQSVFENIHRDLELTATQISFIDEAWKHIFERLRLEALEEGDNLPQTLMYLNMYYEEASHNDDDSNDDESPFVRGSYDKICLVNRAKKESEPIEQVIVSGIAASAMNYAMHQYLKQQILSVNDFSEPLNIKHDYTSLRFDFSVRTFYEAYVEAADRGKRAIYEYDPSFAIKSTDEQKMYILREIMQEQEYAQSHNDTNWLKSKLTPAQYNALQDIEKYFFTYICNQVHNEEMKHAAPSLLEHNILNGQLLELATLKLADAEPMLFGERIPRIADGMMKQKSKQGARPKVLFPQDNNEYQKNEEITQREKVRLLNFIKDHKMGAMPLTASTNDKLNKVIVCFCKFWKDRSWVSEEIAIPALYRFLLEDCKLKTEVAQRTMENCMRNMLKEKVDSDCFYMVKEAFLK